MAVTIKKIAELVGVSAGMVDGTLNNRKGVKADQADRPVSGLCAQFRGSGLVARRREVKFGAIIHTPKNDFIGELLAGIEAEGGSKEDYGVEIRIVYGEEYSVDSQLAMIDGLVKEGVSGLAIIPLHDRRIVGRLKELKENSIFVVLMVSDMDIESLAYVGCDLYRNGRVLGGLTNMLCQPDVRLLYCISPLGIWGNIRRLEGFQAALTDQKRVPSVTVCELQNHDIS